MPDVEITRDGPVGVPMNYTVPNGGELAPFNVEATIDGTGAGSAFYAVLQVLDPNGRSMGKYITSSIAAGASADVTWFPRSLVPAPTSSGGSGPAILFDQTLSGTAASIATAVGGIPQTHTDLLVVTTLRSNEAITGSNSGGLSINSNTANAKQNYLRVANTTVTGNTAGSGAQGINVLALTSANADAGVFGNTWVYIPNYQSGNVVTCLFVDGLAPANAAFTNWLVDVGQGRWNNQTGPVTQITATPNTGGGGQLVAGSRMTVYGFG